MYYTLVSDYGLGQGPASPGEMGGFTCRSGLCVLMSFQHLIFSLVPLLYQHQFINPHIALQPESKYVLIFFEKCEVVFKFWRILGTQDID